MKTLADFKRALTIGSKWHTFHNLYNNDMGIGVVVNKNSVSVQFLREGRERPSSLYFEKSDRYQFDGNKVIVLSDDALPLLTYTLLELSA